MANVRSCGARSKKACSTACLRTTLPVDLRGRGAAFQRFPEISTVQSTTARSPVALEMPWHQHA